MLRVQLCNFTEGCGIALLYWIYKKKKKSCFFQHQCSRTLQNNLQSFYSFSERSRRQTTPRLGSPSIISGYEDCFPLKIKIIVIPRHDGKTRLKPIF